MTRLDLTNSHSQELVPTDLLAVHICTLLRQYNSRSCQLVLAAGALTLPEPKLKRITAKHLCSLLELLYDPNIIIYGDLY